MAETRNVGRIDDLGVFDPPAPVTAVSRRELLDRAQHCGIGFIADRMHCDLEAIERGAAHHVFKRGIAGDAQALGGGIAVRQLQAGPARAECAIGVKLDPVQPQPIIIEPRGRSGAADQHHVVDPCGIGHHPHPQPSSISGAAIGLPVFDAGAHVGGRGDAVAEENVLRECERIIAVFGARWGHGIGHQRLRIVDQHPGWFTAWGDPFNFAASGVFGG